ETMKKQSTQIEDFLTLVNIEFKEKTDDLRQIISNKGTNWDDFNRPDKETIHKALLLAQMIKGILDTPLLDEDGAITEKSAEMLETSKSALKQVQAQKIN